MNARDDINPCYYIARGFHGLSEIDGSDSNPTILGWIHQYFDWVEDDSKLAWCGIFMAIVFKIAGRSSSIPKQPYRARNWASVGDPVDIEDAREGDIVVFWRGRYDDGRRGHVAFYKKNDSIYTTVLGGNQSNKVCYARYGTRKIIAIRRI